MERVGSASKIGHYKRYNGSSWRHIYQMMTKKEINEVAGEFIGDDEINDKEISKRFVIETLVEIGKYDQEEIEAIWKQVEFICEVNEFDIVLDGKIQQYSNEPNDW